MVPLSLHQGSQEHETNREIDQEKILCQIESSESWRYLSSCKGRLSCNEGM